MSLGVSVEGGDGRQVNYRSILTFGGLVPVITGIVLLAWPEATITVLALLLAIGLVVNGVGTLVGAFSVQASPGEKILYGLLGVLALLAGVAVLAEPVRSVELLVVVVGAFWVVSGFIRVLAGIFGSGVESRWLAASDGLISVAFGVVLLAWPGPTLAALVWMIGAWLLVAGLVWMFRGSRMSAGGGS